MRWRAGSHWPRRAQPARKRQRREQAEIVVMRILRHTDPHFATALKQLQRSFTSSPEVEKTVREIIVAVRERGDAALIELTEKFGGPGLVADQLRISQGELRDAKRNISAQTKKAIAAAHENVRNFARRSLR